MLVKARALATGFLTPRHPPVHYHNHPLTNFLVLLHCSFASKTMDNPNLPPRPLQEQKRKVRKEVNQCLGGLDDASVTEQVGLAVAVSY